MKKVLFFALLLLGLGVAGVSAQVRIGGNEIPNEAAVLDLNEDDDTNDGTKGLALPRVSLDSNTAILAGATSNLNGMLVYNTGGTLTAGVYFWDVNRWRLLQTYGLWRRVISCAACPSAVVGTYPIIPWASTGAPSWAGEENCWVNPYSYVQHYVWFVNSDGVAAFKLSAQSTPPKAHLYCWGPPV